MSETPQPGYPGSPGQTGQTGQTGYRGLAAGPLALAQNLAGRTQRLIGGALRDRVAGADAAERGERIWGTPGERWFSPTDPIWRVFADASMFPGGVTALLLQSLHPLAMAGVAGHSGYKGDPWGRLQRTADYLAITTFGTVSAAEEIGARVRDIHTRVRGKDHLGRPYRADDPHLLRWVHVAETYSFLEAHRHFGAEPLTADEADEFVRQTGTVSARLGASDLPQTEAELHAQIEDFRAELEVTPPAIEAARFLLLHPPLPLAARPGYALIAAGGVSLLQPWARAMLRLPAGGPLPAVANLAGQVGARAVRWGLAGLEEDRTAGVRRTAS